MALLLMWLKHIGIAPFYLNGSLIVYSAVTKYLGCYISDELNDDNDMKRHTISIYTKGNVLISKFRKCSVGVKSKHFRSHCSNFYGSTLWSH